MDGFGQPAFLFEHGSQQAARDGVFLEAHQQVERDGERQQQAPDAARGAAADGSISLPRFRGRGQRAFQGEDADDGQQQQGRQEVHFVADGGAFEGGKGHRADPKQQGHGQQKPAEDGARLGRSTAPRERHGQRQPHQRNICQDAERRVDDLVARGFGRHGNFMDEGEATAPVGRFKKIDPEIEPKITQAEGLRHRLAFPGQEVLPAEIERATESQEVVEHQSHADERDGPHRREQRRANLAAFTPGLGDR